MSKSSRIIIGIVALLGAVGFFITALEPEGLPTGVAGFYAMAALFVIIAVACFFPKTHPITLRMIGMVIFCGYVAYVYDSFQTQNFSRAIKGLIFWGLPSGYLAIMGTYPSWGKASAGLNGKQEKSRR